MNSTEGLREHRSGGGEQHVCSWPPIAPVEAQKEADTVKKRLLMFYPKSSSTVTFFVCANWWHRQVKVLKDSHQKREDKREVVF